MNPKLLGWLIVLSLLIWAAALTTLVPWIVEGLQNLLRFLGEVL